MVPLLAWGAAPRGAGDLPAAAASEERTIAGCSEPAPAFDDSAIREQPVCVGSTVHSAGELGPALLYRATPLPEGRISVGYYAFFSEERPWGNNWLTWSLLPALAIDLVYTRALLVAPGLQRAAFGRGDVEGFRIVYAPDGQGGLLAERAVADDDLHRRTELDPGDLFAVDPARITLATRTWSHHLGARLSPGERLVYRRCYGPGSIRPIDGDAIRRFNLDHRAAPSRPSP
jgi:hypothetical protein